MSAESATTCLVWSELDHRVVDPARVLAAAPKRQSPTAFRVLR
ncbi:hypothetical protein O3S80_00850 [Streptomyces sp. Lzd4kr]|nr:hypothetical protein [Streptomyces sp. Lzd4kr]